MSVVGRVWAAALATSLLACIHDVYRSEPIGPPGSRRPETLRVLVFGDFGYQSIPQRLTAGAMRRATRARPFDLALELGDNLYYCGPDPTRPGAETCRFEDDGATVAPGAKPPDDPLFRVNEAPLAGCAGATARRCPSTSRSGTTTSASAAALRAAGARRGRDDATSRVPGGRPPDANVDHAGPPLRHRPRAGPLRRARHERDRPRLRRVHAPGRDRVRPRGHRHVRRRAAPLPRRSPPACRPPRGARRKPPRGAHRAARLRRWRQGPRAFFGGHEHTPQHVSLDGLDVFISGSTAMGAFRASTTRWPARAQAPLRRARRGVRGARGGRARLRIEFVDTSGAALHCCEAGTTGPCRSVSCD